MWAILAMAATRKKGGKVLSLHLSFLRSSFLLTETALHSLSLHAALFTL